MTAGQTKPAKMKSKPKAVVGRREKELVNNNIVNMAMHYNFPDLMWGLGMPISQRSALGEFFYDRFLVYFTSNGENEDIQNKRTWLHHLPDMSTDGTNNALSLALYAAASAFSGTKTGNVPLIQDAWSVYGKALQTHSRLIRSKKKVTAHMLSTSVLLSIFEAMNATSASAYREHVNGAAQMVQLIGTDQCMYGVVCQLYFHIRTQMSFVYLTTRKDDPETIPVEQILRQNLDYDRLPIFQRLVSFVMRLSEIYVGLQEESPGKTGRGEVRQLLDLELYMEVKSGIDALWLEYTKTAEAKGHRLQWTNDVSGTPEYRDPFTALCISFFAAAHILFSILAPRLAVSYLDFTDYYQQVLSCAAYLRAFVIGCSFMRIATPLYLVALHAPKVQQKATAVAYFVEWRRMGMGGISALALENIHIRRTPGPLGWEEDRGQTVCGRLGGQFPTMDTCVKTGVAEVDGRMGLDGRVDPDSETSSLEEGQGGFGDRLLTLTPEEVFGMMEARKVGSVGDSLPTFMPEEVSF
jgi:hypothetical protein